MVIYIAEGDGNVDGGSDNSSYGDSTSYIIDKHTIDNESVDNEKKGKKLNNNTQMNRKDSVFIFFLYVCTMWFE